MRAISESASRVRKALMGGDQHVGECEQARQFIIVQDLAGEILKENATPPSRPDFNASISAFVSMSAPRLTLIRIAPGFISSSVSRRMMWCVTGVSGVCSEITSHSRASTPRAQLRNWTLVLRHREGFALSFHRESIAVRTTAKRKTATAKANATARTRRCSNFPEALAKKSTVANKTVFARY